MPFSRLKQVTRVQSVLFLLTLTGCANGQLGNFFEVRFSPDAAISQSQNTVGSTSNPDCGGAIQQGLPTDFPPALCYPSSVLLDSEVIQATDNESSNGQPGNSANRSEALPGTLVPGSIVQTTWQTDIAVSEIQQFYQAFFDTNNWVTTRLPTEFNNAGLFQATKDGDRITIRFNDFANQPNAGPSDPSGLIAVSRVQPHTYGLEYRLRDDRVNSAASGPDASTDGSSAGTSGGSAVSTSNSFGDDAPGQASAGGTILGRVKDSLTASQEDSEDKGDRTPADADSESLSDTPQDSEPTTVATLEQVPTELKTYVADVVAVKDLLPDITKALESEENADEALRPNSPISRREFVRWLFTANNRMYGDRPTKQLRLGSTTSEPAFSDIPVSDPDFAIIQGFAEAGLIPSRLSGAATGNGADTTGDSAAGDETGIAFQPDAPLAREDLIAWKAPLDQQGALPQGTVEAIQESWGFKDADKIGPAALNAILADYQNGDQSNIRRAFGYTLLLQPQKVVTQAEAIAVLWYFGTAEAGVSAADLLKPPSNSNEAETSNKAETSNAPETSTTSPDPDASAADSQNQTSSDAVPSDEPQE